MLPWRPDSGGRHHSTTITNTHTQNFKCPLLSLPPELLDAILSYVSPIDLVAVSGTCRALRPHAISDIQWYPRVQSNVPGLTLNSPHPCRSYRDLYAAHDPRWFLTKHKIWFCDRHLPGKLLIARYDPRRGCIEGYQLLAVCHHSQPQFWPAASHVVVHTFEPRVHLHLDKPLLQFHIGDGNASPRLAESRASVAAASRFSVETPMTLGNRLDNIFSNFSLAKALPPETVQDRTANGFPYGGVWPPPSISAPHRVAGFALRDEDPVPHPGDRPSCRDAVSDRAFRIRQWIEMAGTPLVPGVPAGRTVPGMMEMITYATLDPALYTPTEYRPFRGIWVGDYSGHGCEFLLMHQPDGDVQDVTDEELDLVRGQNETEDEWQQRRRDARVHRGKLEAVKLTGDPNVPRGELTFIAEDLGEAGFVGIAEDPPFQGARIVSSKGHVAETGFHEGKSATMFYERASFKPKRFHVDSMSGLRC